MKQVRNFIRDFDEIAPPSAGSLHFKGDFLTKSYLGGIASFGVTLFVLYQFWYMNGLMMVTKTDPSLSSLAESLDYEAVGKIQIKDLPKMLFEILENGDNTVDLDNIPGGIR